MLKKTAQQASSEMGGRKKVVIIGGGPAGITAAYKLSRSSVESVVLEKENDLGGISKTVNYKGYFFDIGGHRFFTRIEAVDKIWKEALGKDFLKRKRMSRIYFNNKFFHYPLEPLNALIGLGLRNSFLVLASYIYSHMFPSKREDTFEQWVTNRFGARLYETFFKAYTEKVWGMSCGEIRAEWAAQRIKGLSLFKALKDGLMKNSNNRPVIKSLINGFHYPRQGPGMMWRKLADMARQNGAEISLGAEVVAVLLDKGRVTAVEVRQDDSTGLIKGTHFISSMPIKELVAKIRPAVPGHILEAANGLKYRDFLTVALIIDKGDLFPDNWLYIHDPTVRLGRIQNFKNWSPFMVPDQNKTCLGLEYFCFENDELWNMTDKGLIELGKTELEKLGLVDAGSVEDGAVVRMPKAYPVYDAGYKERLAIVRDYLSGIGNIQLAGRNGLHKYNNQDHSMLTAMLAVENILGADHDIWSVNEGEDYIG